MSVQTVAFHYQDCPACAEESHTFNSNSLIIGPDWDTQDFCVKVDWLNCYGDVTYGEKRGKL
jgi:hypothetical protein